ncbi:unnamed protein product, partial [Urochloa humidicola]
GTSILYSPRASFATWVSTCGGGNPWRDPDLFCAWEGMLPRRPVHLLAGVEDDLGVAP